MLPIQEMNLGRYTNQSRAFTLVELLVVMGIIGILAALLMPTLDQAKERAKRIECVSNLRETGIAFHLFANDHNGKFPAEVSTNDGGSLEYVAAGNQMMQPFYFSYRHFLPAADDIKTPNLLLCPADLQRFPTLSFNSFNNSNLSYVIGLGADLNDSSAILAGDRNFPGIPGASPTIDFVPVTSGRWGAGILHNSRGNILFADAHVEQSYNSAGLIQSEESFHEEILKPDIKEVAPVYIHETNTVAALLPPPPSAGFSALPDAEPVVRPKEVSSDLMLPPVLVESARESWDATRWLLWFFLLLLALFMIARWLDRRARYKKKLPRVQEFQDD